MYIFRNIKWSIVLRFAWLNLLIFFAWGFLAVFLVHFFEHRGINLHIPFLPLSTIGIAVAFYIGFKNNASYDRFWEARKIWGGIVNYSRTWGNQVLSFVTKKDAMGDISDEELKEVQKTLIYRHIAWLNALRFHLRKPNPHSLKLIKTVAATMVIPPPSPEDWKKEVGAFVDEKEFDYLMKRKNVPTQIIRQQGDTLRILMNEKGLIESFRHMEMMRVLEEFYNLQGKCERIKNTPFPRQYAFFSRIFTWIFIFLLPFGMVGEFAQLGHNFVWLTIPFSVLISWIFLTMEMVGDNSEDPFENFINDVPMTALCRTIEIDLRDMLGETDLPPKTKDMDGILM